MQPTQVQDFTRDDAVLAVSLELASKSWKVGLDDGKRKAPAVHGVDHAEPKGRLDEALAVIEKVKKKWGLAPGVRVVVVYEAGQDGFWIQRALNERGYEALVVDPASIPVERRARRAKTDRLDAIRLVLALRAWLRGERDRMKVVRVPPVEAEGQRHLVRDRGTLQKEIGQHRDRLRKLLRTVGCWGSIEGELTGRLGRGEVQRYCAQTPPPPQRRPQADGLEPIRLRSPRLALHRDARRIHHQRFVTARRQCPLYPERVLPRFIHHHHPHSRRQPPFLLPLLDHRNGLLQAPFRRRVINPMHRRRLPLPVVQPHLPTLAR